MGLQAANILTYLKPSCDLFNFTFQWPVPLFYLGLFLLYRIFVLCYLLSWMIVSIFEVHTASNPYPWPTYLTTWSYMTLVCHAVLATFILLVNLYNKWGFCEVVSFSATDEKPRPLLKDSNVSLLDGSSSSSSSNSDKLEDGETEDETDSEVEIYVADTVDQVLSKENHNDATSSNNMVIDIEIATESDSEEDIYDAGEPQKMFLKKAIIINDGDEEEQVPDDLSFLVKLDWLLFNTACCSEIFVSVFYWSFIYWYIVEKTSLLVDIHMHAVNALVVILETVLTAIPVRLLHVVYPVLFGLCYMIFTIVFWSIDHSHVLYGAILDWNSPGVSAAVASCIGLVALPVIQLSMWSLFKLRSSLHKKLHVLKEEP